jgi:hypothetical protein
MEHGASQRSLNPGGGKLQVALVLFALSVFAGLLSLVFWPGQMDLDTQDEWQEAATGHFTDYHTPVLSWLWRGPYLLGLHSPGWILFVGLLSLLVGAYLVLRVRFGRLIATIGAMVCCVFPPVLAWTVHIGRDTWFVVSLLCAFGFVARAVRLGPAYWRSNIAAALGFAFICCASFQIAVFPLFVLFVAIAGLVLPTSVRRRKLLVTAVAIGGCIALVGSQLAIERIINTESLHPEQAIYVYDLAQLSHAEGKNLFPRDDVVRPNKVDSVLRSNVKTGTLDILVWGNSAVIYWPIEGRQLGDLRHAWLTAILHNPIGYLRERASLESAYLAISQPSFWVYQWPPDLPQFRPISTTLQDAGIDYLKPFSVGDNNLVGGPLYRVWVYLLVILAAVPLLWRRGGAYRQLSFLAIAMIDYTVVLFFTGPDLLYRFGYPIVVVGTVMVVALLPRKLPRRRRVMDSTGGLHGAPDADSAIGTLCGQ